MRPLLLSVALLLLGITVVIAVGVLALRTPCKHGCAQLANIVESGSQQIDVQTVLVGPWEIACLLAPGYRLPGERTVESDEWLILHGTEPKPVSPSMPFGTVTMLFATTRFPANHFVLREGDAGCYGQDLSLGWRGSGGATEIFVISGHRKPVPW